MNLKIIKLLTKKTSVGVSAVSFAVAKQDALGWGVLWGKKREEGGSQGVVLSDGSAWAGATSSTAASLPPGGKE